LLYYWDGTLKRRPAAHETAAENPLAKFDGGMALSVRTP
jgi:hypothetical protein